MALKSGRKVWLCCVLAAGMCFVGTQATRARGVPTSEGIVNFGKVSDVLYRGAQPDDSGLESLKRLGVKTIINLRMEDDCWKDESAKALSHGILYTNIPFRGVGRPTHDQVNIYLGINYYLPRPV
jgi:hypothetical protein